MRLVGLKLIVAGLMVLVSAVAQAETRIALIIGNSDYAHTQKLDNPANDAKLLAASLQSIGFQVDSHTDLEQKKLRRAVASFARKITDAGPDTMAFFFYAGHGLQVNGTNFLIPVDAQIEAEADVPVEGISANDIFHTLRAAGAKVNVIVLDACRNNPFKAASRSMSRGLARMVAPAGSIISYATAPGRVAADGDGANSPFTAALAKVIIKPGLTIEQVFKQVRIAVHETTNGQQLPTEESQLLRDVYFAGLGDQPTDPPKDPVTPPTADPSPDPAQGNKDDAQLAFFKALELNTLEAYEDFLNSFPSHNRAGQVREIIKSMSDEQMWLRIKKADTVAGYQRYLIAFAEGIYASEAKERVRRLQQQAKLDPQPDPPKIVEPPKVRDPQPGAGTCGAPHGKYRVRGVSSNDVLNIRSGPGSKYAIVGDIPPNGRGVGVESCANNSRWCIVRYNCYRGWASNKYLTKSGSSSGGGGSPARLYRVIDHIPPDMLNVRSGPGTKNRITSRIPHNGINVKVASCRTVGGYRYKWCVVTYRGNRGWAYARYLADMNTGARPR